MGCFMARIRSIKPEFWQDEHLSSLCAEGALLAIGLLNQADDEGYFNANPKLIQSCVFPLRELSGTVPVLLQDLVRIGYVQLFSGSDGKRYGKVSNFAKHQVINKPKPSKIKDLCSLPDEYGIDTVLVPVGKERKGKEQGKEQGKEKTSTASQFDFLSALILEGVDEQIARDWIAVRKAKRSSNTKTALEATKKEAGKAGYSLQEALTVCCRQGWAGFNAEWVQKDRKITQHQANQQATARALFGTSLPSKIIDMEEYDAKRITSTVG
jgi:hypothetical protein